MNPDRKATTKARLNGKLRLDTLAKSISYPCADELDEAFCPLAPFVVGLNADGTEDTGTVTLQCVTRTKRSPVNQAYNQKLRGWLAATARGEQQAFTEFFDETNCAVFSLAQRILRHRPTAEEVTLDVFMQVWRQAASYDVSRGTPLAWLMMLTRSRALDRRRLVTRRLPENEDLAVANLTTASDADPEVASIFAERRRLVRDALAQLTPAQRLLIVTAFFEGLSHSEIAARFNLPLGTVKTRIRAGMTMLRKHLLAQ